MSGFAIAMVGVGALAVYSAIKGTSPLAELRAIITGKRPEPLGTEPRGKPFDPSTGATNWGSGTFSGGSGKARTVGAVSYVADEARFIAATWGIVADATRVSTGHIPGSDHYTGHAIDAMLPPGIPGSNIGDAILNHYIQNAKVKRVKYVIFKHTIWSDTRGTHRYSKNDHFNHVHISFH
jgi:hypothetical protein